MGTNVLSCNVTRRLHPPNSPLWLTTHGLRPPASPIVSIASTLLKSTRAATPTFQMASGLFGKTWGIPPNANLRRNLRINTEPGLGGNGRVRAFASESRARKWRQREYECECGHCSAVPLRRSMMRQIVGGIAIVVAMAAACGSAFGQEIGKKVTAQEVVDAIKAHVGVEWRQKTVDTFKTGDPNTVVTGVAVTMMASLDVLQRAVAAGDNMVITHEPIFFNHMLEQPEGMDASDAVWTAKREFIEKNHLVIWKFHD